MNSCSREPNLGTRATSCTQGCLLDQLAGDAMGSLVEFRRNSGASSLNSTTLLVIVKL